MHQHAVPRQITTFEFKLVGFMSIKQFVYLSLFVGSAAVLYLAIPFPYINIMTGLLTAAFGAFFTFYKYNDRHLDAWIKNFFVAITQPSQYLYHKENAVPAFLADVYLSTDPATSATHIDANKKLSNYMAQTGQAAPTPDTMQHITKLIIETNPRDHTKAVVGVTKPKPKHAPQNPSGQKKPVISGIVKNTKNEVLEGIMLYINTSAGETVRILKTNHNGVFATFHALPNGDYTLNPKDLNATYFFDTMNITIDGSEQKPVTIYSKEML